MARKDETGLPFRIGEYRKRGKYPPSKDPNIFNGPWFVVRDFIDYDGRKCFFATQHDTRVDAIKERDEYNDLQKKYDSKDRAVATTINPFEAPHARAA